MKVVKKVFDQNLLLFTIFIIAFLLRIVGTNPGYLNHPDEPKIADAALNITFHLNFEPVAFYYGSLLPIIYALINFIFILPFYFLLYVPFNLELFDCVSKSGLPCLLQASKEFFNFLTRYETAFLSSISVVLLYYLGKKLFNKEVGVVAAFFTAINYRHVLSSHFALADAPLTVFIIIACLLSLRLLEKNSLKNYLLAGLGLGLTLSVKYFLYAIPLLITTHLLVSLKSKKLKEKITSILSLKFVLLLLVALLTFILLNPYIFINPISAREQYELNSMFYGVTSINLFNFDKVPMFSVYYLYEYGLGKLISIITILGFIYSAFKFPKQTLLLSSLIIPFIYFFLIISGTTFVRNFASVLPLVTLFPALFITEITRLYNKRVVLAYLVAILLSIPTIQLTSNTSLAFMQTNNYKLLETWVLEELPDNSKVVKSWGTPFPGRKQVDLTDWSPYSSSYQSLEELLEKRVEWVILSSESGVYINHFLNLLETQDIFKDHSLKFLEDNYVSLLTRELASYRVNEFNKPYGLDPSFMAIKIPSFETEKINLPVSNFRSKTHLVSSCFSVNSGDEIQLTSLTEEFKRGLRVTKLFLGESATEQKWYRLSANVKGESLNPKSYRSKFLRLDFHSADALIKTYVSKQIREDGVWVTLSAAGLAPPSSTHMKASFQIDDCSPTDEIYSIKDVQVTEANNLIEVNQYPYFNIPLTKNFIWLPPL